MGKWAPFISSIKFSTEPVKIVLSGLHAPMHHVKSLCMVTLGDPGESLRVMMSSLGTIGSIDSHTLVLIDISEKDELEFLNRIQRILGELIEDLKGPARSASSSRDDVRITYSCKVKTKGAYAARIANYQVKVALTEMRAIVGLSSTYSDSESLLIDASNVDGAIKVIHLTEDAVMVSSKLMLARSSASVKQWIDRVGEIIGDDDNAFIDKVRYRPSQGGGIVTTAPVLHKEKDRKKCLGREAGSKELQIVIRFSGEFINGRLSELSSYMEIIGRNANLTIPYEPSEVVEDIYQWKPLIDSRYGWQGDVILRCKNKEQAILMYSHLEGKSISTPEGVKIVLEVIPHASIVIEARIGLSA